MRPMNLESAYLLLGLQDLVDGWNLNIHFENQNLIAIQHGKVSGTMRNG